MSDESEVLRQAAAIARSRRDPEKLREHARTIAGQRKGKPLSEEHKAKLREAQQERREREQAERTALGLDVASAPKRPRGRPKKNVTIDTQQG